MSNISNFTQDINIMHPDAWKLALRIDPTGLQFSMHSIIEENSLIYRDYRFGNTSEGYLKTLENTIYDNPVFIQDFNMSTILIESYKFLVIPQEFSGEESIRDMFLYSFPGFNGDILTNKLIRNKATIAFGVEKGVESFLNRTFNNPPVYHHLTPLCEYFHKKSRLGNVSKLYVHLRKGIMDICAFNKNGLALANTFRFNHNDDALFYILNVWQQLKLDIMNDELQISGDRELRDELLPLLRKYITYVMPLVFPSALLKAGKDAMNAPFDLIILPLCE